MCECRWEGEEQRDVTRPSYGHFTGSNLFILIWRANISSLKLCNSDECYKYAIGAKVTEVEVLHSLTTPTTTHVHTRGHTHTHTFLSFLKAKPTSWCILQNLCWTLHIITNYIFIVKCDGEVFFFKKRKFVWTETETACVTSFYGDLKKLWSVIECSCSPDGHYNLILAFFFVCL